MRGFGKRLARLRKHKSMSQTAFANAVGVTKTAVWQWEHDVHFPSRKLEKLADVLECSLADLLADVEAPLPPTGFCHQENPAAAAG